MLHIDTTSATASLQRLNAALGIYARMSKHTAKQALARKAQQVLLGIGFAGEKKPGLFDELAATAPKRGAINAARAADGWRVGSADSRSLMWARDRAILLLAGRKSAPFRMRTGTSGAAEYIASVQAGKVVTRGKRKGTIRFGSRAKTLADAYRTTRAAARQAGGVLLNERALINALTVQRREKSRLATAAQVLPKRYRTVLKRMAGREYRGGQLVGVSSTDAAMMQEHAQVLIQNRKGRQIGSLVFGGFVGASVNIRGEMGLHTQDQVNRLARVLTAATDDTMAYIRRKQGEIAPGISRK